MKRTLMKMLVLLSLLFISVGSTVAYLTDTEQEVNVMTLGRVEIDLIEQERNSAGALVDFQDFHPLYPGYHPNGLNEFDDEGYWVNVRNAIDKVVTVKNTGKAPAYVRLWFAFEVTGEDNFLDEKLHLNRDDAQWEWYFLDDDEGDTVFLNLNGARYAIAIATYPEVLAPNATTPVSLRQVLLDSSATNDDYLKLGDKYSIFVVAQGMQTEGFDDAHHALNEGFGVPSATNHPFADMTEEDAGDDTDSDFTIYPTEKIDWYTGGIQELLPKGAVFEIYDVETKIIWTAKRGTGDNHAEIEPLTQADTAKLCAVYGVNNPQEIVDKNLYERRPCLVTVDGRTFACSLYGIPHNSDADTIVNNGMDGVLCLFFTNSTNHADSVDASHEAAIEYAYQNAPNGQKQDDIPADALVISTPEELMAFRDAVSSEDYLFVNRTVVLGNDIDMAGQNWSHIVVWINNFQGIFDGQGHTISNLNGSLFGPIFSDGELIIRNVTIDKANIESSSAGAIMESCDSYSNITIDNCHVSNSTIKGIEQGEYSRAGGIAGCIDRGRIINCSVKNCSIYTTVLAGQLVGESFGTEISDCKVDNVKLYLLTDEGTTTYVPSSSECSTTKGVIHREMIFDQEAHWQVCSECDIVLGDECCVFDCKNPEVCIFCGRTDGEYGWRSIHHWTLANSASSTTHQIVCEGCGETGLEEKHHAYCQEADAGICAGCGKSGVTIGQLWHDKGYINITDDTHDRGCTLCGYVERTAEHRYYGDDTQCWDCGKEKPERYVIVLNNGVNLRKYASSSSSVVTKVNAGTVLRYDTKEGDWYEVDYKGSICYVSASVVQAQVGYVKTTAANVLLRVTPSGDAYSTKITDQGTVLPYFGTETSDGHTWYYIFYDGYLGYIRGDFVLLCDADGTSELNG